MRDAMWTIDATSNINHGPLAGPDSVSIRAHTPGVEAGWTDQLTLLLPMRDTRSLTGDQVNQRAKERLIEACRQIVAEYGS
jgi:hypothetical protein